jgi:RNA polymerase sigma-70 factor (ECF subfamily)
MAVPGDEFERLFRAHYGPLVRALTVAGGAPDDAADAVQDAFVQLHRHWARIGRYDDPVRWLRRVAINRVANQQRGSRRRQRAIARLQPELVAGDDGPNLDLREAIASLAPQQSLAVSLHYLAGLAVLEVAEVLSVSEGTVKSQLHDARRRLRERLEVNDG